MARQREKSKQAADVNADFPYRDLLNHPAWAALDAELTDLVANGDVELTTARQYVIGALVRKLVDQHLTVPALPASFAAEKRTTFRWMLQIEVDPTDGLKPPVAKSSKTRDAALSATP